MLATNCVSFPTNFILLFGFSRFDSINAIVICWMKHSKVACVECVSSTIRIYRDTIWEIIGVILHSARLQWTKVPRAPVHALIGWLACKLTFSVIGKHLLQYVGIAKEQNHVSFYLAKRVVCTVHVWWNSNCMLRSLCWFIKSVVNIRFSDS